MDEWKKALEEFEILLKSYVTRYADLERDGCIQLSKDISKPLFDAFYKIEDEHWNTSQEYGRKHKLGFTDTKEERLARMKREYEESGCYIQFMQGKETGTFGYVERVWREPFFRTGSCKKGSVK